MENILHSVYLKHDTSQKSLTKQALAQIILKIIYQNGERGIKTQKIRRQLKILTGVSFDTNDIEAALLRLKNVDKKIHVKNGNHFIHQDYRDTIATAVEESSMLHEKVINKWFGKSEIIRFDYNKLEDWFKNLLIDFFKDYSNDWIRDLKPGKNNGKKNRPNIDTLIDKRLIQSKIDQAERLWLKQQFVGFIESEEKDDIDLLWIYGSSMFSATLLTARNYADEFSLEIFKEADFILDTNILMILELEGFEKNYTLKAIEECFFNLKITPKYFKISQEEYLRTIGPKRDSTLAALEKYEFDVICELDCAFVQTAIMRQCRSIEDFKQFFLEVADIPSRFHEKILLQCEDYSELDQEIVQGENDEKLKQEINKIYRKRANVDKRDRPKQHDAGLFRGVEFLNKDKKTLILTMDNVLRELAYENTIRDNYPLAIGLDSLIQMMAINSGGTDIESSNFAPLFGRLVKASLFPEKETFKPEDLEFILKTRIQISELPKEKVLAIAKTVNTLRMKGVPDEDIVLEIQRAFNVNVSGFTDEIDRLKSQKQQEKDKLSRAELEKDKLESELFKDKYKIELQVLRIKVLINWVKSIGILLFIGILVYVILYFISTTNEANKIILSFAISLLGSSLISFVGLKLKLFITKLDKENLKTKVLEKIINLKTTSS